MKLKIHLFHILAICWITAYELHGQTVANDSIQVGLQVTKPKGLSIDNATLILQERLKQAVVLNGAARDNSPFRLETEVLLLSCQATPSTPIQMIAELEIICSITDLLKEQTVQQTTFQLRGIDTTKDKAILNAVKQLRARDPKLKKCIVRGKEKLMESYRLELQEIYESQNTQE